jgi:hypothetical protein
LKNLFKISEVVLLILSFFIIQSCEKDIIESDKYLIEMNSEYRISRVTKFVSTKTVEFEKSYEYSDKYVKIQIKGGPMTTYYLNQSGLADSSSEGSSRIQYHYDQNNFLTSYSYLAGSNTIYYQYADGNKIKYTWGSTKAYYQYNSQINLVDIDNFHGTYLGKLNNNLIESARLEFLMASNGVSIDYKYTLNSAGLVIQRIEISTNKSEESHKKTITKFEYVINK